jgi:hypothetical protein
VGEKIQCEAHGECEAAFVCEHLLGESVGLGFNRNDPVPEDLFPDAWCDDCEIVRVQHDGWNERSEALVKIVMLCSVCYERTRMRNTRPTVTLDDLADLQWKCHTCEEWHSGPCFDFGHRAPYYWTEHHEKLSKRSSLLPRFMRRSKTLLDEDFCVIEDDDFFVRGIIHLPILGAAETFRWGVWGSLSRDNFELLMETLEDPKRVDLAPMFSWLSTQIEGYPATLHLKMYAHIQPPGTCPHFRLELTDHPLSQEYHKGIAPERVKEIMLGRLREAK